MPLHVHQTHFFWRSHSVTHTNPELESLELLVGAKAPKGETQLLEEAAGAVGWGSRRLSCLQTAMPLCTLHGFPTHTAVPKAEGTFSCSRKGRNETWITSLG